MTATPVRTTQFASWVDKDAWMESMKGPRWDATLKEEAALVKSALAKPAVKQRLPQFRALYGSASEAQKQSLPFQCGAIQIQWKSQFFKVWSALGSSTQHEVRDLVVEGSSVWCTVDIGDGAEEFELQYWESGYDKAPKWKLNLVGPDVGILGNKLFYLGVRNKLQYHILYSCDAKTGANRQTCHQVKSAQHNLTLERQAECRLLLLEEDSQDLKVYELAQSGALIPKPSRWIVPRSWILPLQKESTPIFVWAKRGYLITQQHGAKTLWRCGSKQSAEKLLSLPVGEILLNPWAVWNGNESVLVVITQPDKGTAYYTLTDSTLTLAQPVRPTGLITRRFEGRSKKDHTIVFGCLTYLDSKTPPSKLLVIGYGAYGMPTSIGSVLSRWAPLVHNGWCIAHTFLRGGGDHTEEWAKAGRREGRVKTVDDFEGLVFAAQQEMRILPSKTAIYGRSAGGLVMGEMLRRDPDGEQVQAVYTEVPYVDELRTTTNPSLPLTVLEYNEFGNPAARLDDFLHVGLTSPADSAAGLKTPSTFVLTRTAAHDSQVFAYESVKWIRRLRDASKEAPKLCIVEADQGHFTPPEKTLDQWSVDCALLDAWMEGGLR